MNFSKNNISIKPLPYLRIFLFVFALLNLVGIPNFPFFSNTIDNTKLYILFGLGVLGFFFGSMFLRTFKPKITITQKGRFKPKILFYFFIGFNLLALIMILLTHVINGGIIILNAGNRFHSIPFTNIIVYTSIIVNLVYLGYKLITNNRFKKRYVLFLLIQSVLILSLGYRSPLIILLGGSSILFLIVRNDHQNRFKQIFSVKNLIGVLLIFLLMSYVSAFRTGLKYDFERYYRNINHTFYKDNPMLKQFVPSIALFRYDQEVVKQLIEETKADHYYLGLAASNFKTILPGKQLAARNIIGKIIGARENPNGQPWSVTPTLQGALFVDGGYSFVFIGFFLIGIIIDYLKKITVQNKDPFFLALYAFIMINALMALHTGYFDVIFYIIITIILLLRFVTMRVNFSLTKH